MKQRNKKIVLLMVMCLIVTSITAFPKNASALRKQMAFSNSDKEGTFYVEGGEYSSSCGVVYSTTQATTMIGVNIAEIHIRNDGTVWYVYDNILEYYNFYASGATQTTEVSAVAVYDDSSGNAYCYKTPSGEYYYLPSYENLKEKNYVTEKVADEDIPAEPTSTESPAATSKPTSTKKPSIGTADTNKITVKKSGNSVAVTEDGEVISKVTFNKSKGTATFRVKSKNKKVTKVKQAFIIGDSYNYGYITKANKFKTINRKTGKTKTYSGKWKKATIKKNVAVNVVKLKGSKKKKITGF